MEHLVRMSNPNSLFAKSKTKFAGIRLFFSCIMREDCLKIKNK